MQSRGGRGNGASLLGKDGLVALAVEGSSCALDIGRQRDVAEATRAIREGRPWKLKRSTRKP